MTRGPDLRRARIRALALLAALSLLTLARPGPAAAHGIVIDSSPRHQETVAPPKQLVIRFNGRLEKRLCSVSLTGPEQTTILLVRREADTSPDTLIYPLPALKPGPYRARWKVLAADGHVTEGVLRFTVSAAVTSR